MDKLRSYISDPNIMLSSKLMDQLAFETEIPEEHTYEAIASYLLLLKFIVKLGWVEHTGDWDPNMYIKTKDGTEYETGFGYGDCVELHDGDIEIPLKDLNYLTPDETKNLFLVFNSDHWDDEDLKSFKINIHDIQSIFMDW